MRGLWGTFDNFGYRVPLLFLLGLLSLSPVRAEVIVSEISAIGNLSFLDTFGEDSDWIEIENRSSQEIDLDGWSLSDDPETPRKWTFSSLTLAPDERVVVFASGRDGVFGVSEEVHTNFRLESEGETVLLTPPPGSPHSPDSVAYPEQRGGYTYGRLPDSLDLHFLDTPTPGEPNQSSETLLGVLSIPTFSPPGGVFEDGVSIEIASSDPGVRIYYTLDRSDPTPASGMLYQDPIEVTSTQTLRAAAFLEGYVPSPIRTQTYWFEVDPKLTTLPLLSFTFDPEDLLGENGLRGTDSEGNPNAVKRGPEWERPVAVEYRDFDDPSRVFAIDAGARMHGNDSQRVGSKPSFRLYFRDEYGEDRLPFHLIQESSIPDPDALVIRGGHQDARNPFIQDELARRLFADMGQVASVGTFVHLQVNGDYFGYYNPVERYNVEFFQRRYDSTASWNVLRNRTLGEGSTKPFEELFEYARTHSLSDPQAYREISQRLDLVNFVDYLLVNVYGSTWDWPGNNVTISHEDIPGGKIRYHVWDAEGSFGLRANVANDTTMIELLDGGSEESNLFLALIENPDFVRLFASRVRTHFFENGALTNAHVIDRFLELREEVIGAIPNFVPTVAFIWVPYRRHYLMAHLFQHGLIQEVDTPVDDEPQPAEFPPPLSFSGPEFADVDGDGTVGPSDLYLVMQDYRNNPSAESFGALIGNGTDWQVWSYPVGRGVMDLTFADLGNRGRPDLLAVNGNYGSLLVLRNQGGGTFSAPEFLTSGLGAAALATADFDGDGFVDVLTGNDGMTGQSVTLFLNDGKGNLLRFLDREILGIEENEYLHIRQMETADFDRDGALDVLIGFHTAYLEQTNRTAVLFGDGQGGFTNLSWVDTGDTRLLGASMMGASDFDQDGRPEAVVLDGTLSALRLRMDSSRSFLEPESLPAPGRFEQVTLEVDDMDGDGNPDLIFGEGPSGSVRILFNSGTGQFSATDSVRLIGTRPENIITADLDGDPLPEIIACNLNPALLPASTIQIFWNLGNREFEVGDPMPLGGEIVFPGWLAAADVDRDGDGDIAVSDEYNGRVTLFRNLRNRKGGNPDLNHDGKVDFQDLQVIATEWRTVTAPRSTTGSEP